MARLSSWCKGGDCGSCGKQMVGVDGKKFRCSCPCHLTPEQEQAAIVAAKERRDDHQNC
jgi:hypothetical protein